ncbi:MAG: DUF2970 domain-containing protein [Gammaproteobacteria bacterium]|nr:DUF2970 domain-containing protein [Gammaproteobacteria bacterium]
MTDKENTNDDKLSFGALMLSVLSAFLGVQSNANRERDFSKGRLSHFIIIGLLFGLIFILVVVGVVNLVMHLAGA